MVVYFSGTQQVVRLLRRTPASNHISEPSEPVRLNSLLYEYNMKPILRGERVHEDETLVSQCILRKLQRQNVAILRT